MPLWSVFMLLPNCTILKYPGLFDDAELPRHDGAKNILTNVISPNNCGPLCFHVLQELESINTGVKTVQLCESEHKMHSRQSKENGGHGRRLADLGEGCPPGFMKVCRLVQQRWLLLSRCQTQGVFRTWRLVCMHGCCDFYEYNNPLSTSS